MTSSMQCAEAENAVYYGMQSPGHIYDIAKSERLTTPRTFGVKFNPLPTTKARDTEKVAKIPEHGMYNPPDAFKTTQINGQEKTAFKIVNCKEKTYTDIVINRTKFVPGVGHYKNVEESYKRLSTSPTSIRIRRH